MLQRGNTQPGIYSKTYVQKTVRDKMICFIDKKRPTEVIK